MNRSMLALCLLAFAAGASAEAAGGFKGPGGVRSVTVAEAKNLPDDSQVKVTGRIVRSTGDEEYEFEDESGSMIVEIDDDDWRGIEADPSTVVELTGEVDHDANEVELDVDRLTLLR